MRSKIDLDSWPRKAHYEFFKSFTEPFFGVTVVVDCTQTYEEAPKGILFTCPICIRPSLQPMKSKLFGSAFMKTQFGYTITSTQRRPSTVRIIPLDMATWITMQILLTLCMKRFHASRKFAGPSHYCPLHRETM